MRLTILIILVILLGCIQYNQIQNITCPPGKELVMLSIASSPLYNETLMLKYHGIWEPTYLISEKQEVILITHNAWICEHDCPPGRQGYIFTNGTYGKFASQGAGKPTIETKVDSAEMKLALTNILNRYERNQTGVLEKGTQIINDSIAAPGKKQELIQKLTEYDHQLSNREEKKEFIKKIIMCLN